MNVHHKEIILLLEKIPKVYKDYTDFEKNLSGNDEMKKKLSQDAYVTSILNYEARLKTTKDIKRRLFTIGFSLEAAQPDFNLNCTSKEMMQNYINAVGRVGVSERTKLQMDLLELLELKRSFSTLGSLLDGSKVKALESYLKGRKQ